MKSTAYPNTTKAVRYRETDGQWAIGDAVNLDLNDDVSKKSLSAISAHLKAIGGFHYNPSTLGEMSKVSLAFPEGKRRPGIAWSAYREVYRRSVRVGVKSTTFLRDVMRANPKGGHRQGGSGGPELTAAMVGRYADALEAEQEAAVKAAEVELADSYAGEHISNKAALKARIKVYGLKGAAEMAGRTLSDQEMEYLDAEAHRRQAKLKVRCLLMDAEAAAFRAAANAKKYRDLVTEARQLAEELDVAIDPNHHVDKGIGVVLGAWEGANADLSIAPIEGVTL